MGVCVFRLVRRRAIESLAPGQRLVAPVAVARATLHHRQHSLSARSPFSPRDFRGRFPQVPLPRARQQHTKTEEYAEALKHLQDRLEKYRKICSFLFASAFGTFGVLFFGINAVPEGTQALDKKKIRLAAELATVEKKMEGVKEEVAGHQAFVKKSPSKEEQSAENAPSSE